LPDVDQSEVIGIASLGLIALAGAVIWWRISRKKDPTPDEVEAHRRAWLARYGKLSGGEIIEIDEMSLSYTYAVRSLNYTASQDISALRAYLPEDHWSIIGGVGVRYDPRNPANSVVLCETWSGLPKRQPSTR
jgi:hypothetical protein